MALPRALRDSLRDSELRFGTSMSGIEPLGATGLATFSDGTAGEHGLAAGADGSRVRESLFPARCFLGTLPFGA